MNLKEKIGQLLIVGFPGSRVSTESPVIQAIKKFNLGGVILFDRFLAKKRPDNNIISANQTTTLISDLQDAADGNLLVCVDQEGGRVSRFSSERGFNETPPAGKLGAMESTAATMAAAEQTASLLAELGFNLNLAPVVDLDTYPENPIVGKYQRAFSSDPATVAAHAEMWVRMHRKYKVRTCLKHFPGHGSSRTDSHLGFVDVSRNWNRMELDPYRLLIERGMVDTVMTGHLFNAVLDSEYPATLSAKTVNGLLRTELNYRGPVLSDDMQMGAITNRYSRSDAVCRALAAGIDLLIFGNNLEYEPDVVENVIQAVQEGVQRGKLTEEKIEAAWRRVQLLKQPQQQ